MKKFTFAFLVASFATGAAMAQSEDIVITADTTATVESAQVVRDYSFDLDRVTDPSLVPLPADAGDYEIAAPGEAATSASYTFDLE